MCEQAGPFDNDFLCIIIPSKQANSFDYKFLWIAIPCKKEGPFEATTFYVF